MVTINIFKDNFDSICKDQIWKALTDEADLAKQNQDKKENTHKKEPNRYRDEHLIRKNVDTYIYITYILKNIETKEQIKEIASNLNYATDKTLAEFKETEFYDEFSKIYGLNTAINTIYANTKVISEYYDTFTNDLGLSFFEGWKDNPDSLYRKYLAETSETNLIFIIDAKNGEITISNSTENTYVNWRGNVYIDKKPEL
ncbi:MAG: hypothetical protein K0B07_02915 [DPANN group archaeon]|nr:hypothetical protein [DPANN group archaeon]